MRLRNVFNTSRIRVNKNGLTWWYVLKTSWRYLCKTSWRRLEDFLEMILQEVFQTSWQDLLKMSWRRLEEVLKTSWRCLENVLKTLWQDVLKKSWRRFENRDLKQSLREYSRTGSLHQRSMSSTFVFPSRHNTSIGRLKTLPRKSVKKYGFPSWDKRSFTSYVWSAAYKRWRICSIIQS